MSSDSTDEQTRGRGVLTPADREFLQKSESERKEDYTRQGRSDARDRIRERTTNSLIDFVLLHQHLGADDRQEIFEESTYDIDSGIHGLLAFLWQHATDSRSYYQDATPLMSPESELERWLERGIYLAQTNNTLHVDGPALTVQPVDVCLDVENLEEISSEKINEKLRDQGVEALNDHELQFLLWLGRREQVAGESFMNVGFETVLAEYTDRIDDEWGLRGQYILGHSAYADDAERTERAKARSQHHGTNREETPDAPVGGYRAWLAEQDDE